VKKFLSVDVVWREVVPRPREKSCFDGIRAARAAITRGSLEELWAGSGDKWALVADFGSSAKQPWKLSEISVT
jgi:hypothetical protein